MELKDYLLKFYVAQNGETITPDLAKMLVDEMTVTDGSSRTTGEKWTMEQAKEVGDKIGVDFDAIPAAEWYLVMNMMYSDYYNIGRKYGHTDFPFFADLAAAWFMDSDGKENKTFKYFFC